MQSVIKTGRIMKLTNRLGERHGMALVIERAPNKSEKDTNARWLCRCDCGKEFVTYGQDLKRGRVKSCGCFTRSTIGKRSKHFNATHGLSDSKLYRNWASMLRRCENPTDVHWEHYGGRGIKVSENWQKFETFLSDMGYPPDGMTLDRIDNDQGYSKENCRWATRQEQSQNRRSSVMLSHNGITMTRTEWARALGISVSSLINRIASNFPPEKLFAKNMKPKS